MHFNFDPTFDPNAVKIKIARSTEKTRIKKPPEALTSPGGMHVIYFF